MVYLPTTPLSPALGDDIPTDSQRGGPSEPDLDPPRLNRQSLVQSHHDDPVANQIAFATNQNLIQSPQSNSSPRILSHESVRLFHSIEDPERI
jgi:hypothetical protein